MKKLLFFQQGTFSHSNQAILDQLRKRLADVEIVTVEVNSLIKKRPILIAANLLHVLRDYGLDVPLRRRDLDDAFFGTRRMFRHVRQIAMEAHARHRPDVSFATQSNYDFSGAAPHFVLTDHTYLSCRDWPLYGRFMWNPHRPDWLVALERTIYENAACTFTMGGPVARTLVEQYGIDADRVMNARCGCNAPQQKLMELPTPVERYKAKRVLFVGIDWHRKGGPALVEAFAEVRKGHPDATLTILGCRPKRLCEGAAALGRVGHDEVVRQYARASVFALPSIMEPVGMSYIEAMTAGLPVVASGVAGPGEMIGPARCGWLVKPGDAGETAAALHEAFADADRCRTMGLRGRELVRTQWNWDATGEMVAERMAQVAGLQLLETHKCQSV